MKINFNHDAEFTHEVFGVSKERIKTITQQMNEANMRGQSLGKNVEHLLTLTEDPAEILFMTLMVGVYSNQ